MTAASEIWPMDDVAPVEFPRRVTWADVREIEALGWTISPGVELSDGHRVCAILGDWVRYLNVVKEPNEA